MFSGFLHFLVNISLEMSDEPKIKVTAASVPSLFGGGRGPTGVMSLDVEGGIGDACVVDGLEAFLEDVLGGLDVEEGDGALAEESFGDLSVDDAVVCRDVA